MHKDQTELDKKNEIIVKIMYLLSEGYSQMSSEDLNGFLEDIKSKTQVSILLQDPDMWFGDK